MSTVTDEQGEIVNFSDELDDKVMEKLAEDTPDDAVLQRAGQGGRTFLYVKESFFRWRLNKVLGPSNWQYDTTVGANHCRTLLQITLPSGKVVSRAGISGFDTKMGKVPIDDVNVVKASSTDSFKRACNRFGIACDIGDKEYDPDSESHAPAQQSPPAQRSPQQNQSPRQGAAPNRQPQGNSPQGQNYGPPRTGKALFAWTMKMEQEGEKGLLDWINNEAVLESCPQEKMVDWPEDWVKWGYETMTNAINRKKAGAP